MIRRADERVCLASTYLSWLIELLPIDASLQLRTEDVSIPGANFSARVVWTATVRSRAVDLHLDVVAHRDGDSTIVGAFVSVEEPFPPLVSGHPACGRHRSVSQSSGHSNRPPSPKP